MLKLWTLIMKNKLQIEQEIMLLPLLTVQFHQQNKLQVAQDELKKWVRDLLQTEQRWLLLFCDVI